MLDNSTLPKGAANKKKLLVHSHLAQKKKQPLYVILISNIGLQNMFCKLFLINVYKSRKIFEILKKLYSTYYLCKQFFGDLEKII